MCIRDSTQTTLYYGVLFDVPKFYNSIVCMMIRIYDIALIFLENCTEGDTRLVGGPNFLEGRVEICLEEKWGTICDRWWDIADAQVACYQMGFSTIGSQELKLLNYC